MTQRSTKDASRSRSHGASFDDVRTLIAFLFFLTGACSSSTPDRWEAYPGCGADQCQTWYEECRAECLNRDDGNVVTCQTTCGSKIDACRLACASS
ncbi:MAG: hypothetical protein ACFB9M_14340 [Myxococcota bacterium]